MSTTRSSSDQYDLVAWLRNQLDLDERDIEESRALSGDLHWSMPDWLHRDRMLADVDAKRRIIDEHAVVDNGGGELDSRYCSCCYADRGYNADVSNRTGEGPLVWCQTVRLLALPYAVDRPGYDEGWRP